MAMHVNRPTSHALASLRPARRQTLVSEVASQLEQLILGTLKPGERLPPERDLASSLEVSRLVIREAIKLLAERGLVIARHGSGTFVEQVGVSAFHTPFRLFVAQHAVATEDLFMLRTDLEGAIAFHAATRSTPTDTLAMRANLDEMARVVDDLRDDPNDPVCTETFAWCDLTFHQMLATATRNPLYETTLTPLMDTLLDVRRQGVRVGRATASEALHDHQAILEAIEARDPAQARKAMVSHLERVRTWVQSSVAEGRRATGETTESACKGNDVKESA